jgi:hypothetical protein
MTDRGLLLDYWKELADRERKIVLAFVARLLAGQKIHGKLSPGKKNWKYEACEESLDAAVYMCALLHDTMEDARIKADEVAEGH